MTEPIRIPPEEVRKLVQADEALFVCAYDDEEKFKKMHLEGGISFAAFKALAETMPKDREIIFYCA
jgi:rhodanese-related sulfurtransferase